MRPHAVTLGDEQHGIAVEREAGRPAAVSAVGQVDDFAVAFRADQSYV